MNVTSFGKHHHSSQIRQSFKKGKAKNKKCLNQKHSIQFISQNSQTLSANLSRMIDVSKNHKEFLDSFFLFYRITRRVIYETHI